ncbi:translation initiation factor IF-3 [Mycoplasmopsis pulmonis]|uniref:translation initiation factor IF-3 n=1 Tax=Mycoplasmopsis pulmonis TaxID=2107 RepID=UPI00101C9B40|nr:translation initiation factor IF-3 [Mycoplasmopsis pulmonis]MDZ7293218.1 translation initiation factor IF-3 [Mycoplasmopsis pulmonis]
MLNNDIPFSKVFLIGEDGEKIGIKTKEEALDIARGEKKDLVLISVQPKPIARILDYGKFKYDRKKKEKEQKEKQTNINNRQIRLTPLIGDHDLLTKAKKTRELLLKGDRIKVSLKFKGREIARKELGIDTLNRFYEQVEDIAKIDKEPKLNQDRFLDMYLHPDKQKIAKYLKEKGEDNAKNEK